MSERRRQIVITVITGTCLAIAVYATQPKPPDAVHRATVLPDRIILSWTQDPATTQAVTWRTNTSVKQSFAQIAVAEDGPEFEQNATQVSATVVPIISDLGKYHYHSAEFTGLTPKTTYAYRLGDDENWGAWNNFHTASTEAEPFRFVYFGDAQKQIRSHWSRLLRTAYSSAPHARFFMHGGDLIDRQGRDWNWGEWHEAAGWLNAVIPSLAVPGNHEYEHGVGRTIKQLSAFWQPQFQFPQNGPPGLEDTTYWLDYQGVRFIALNSNERIEEQTVWLEKVLEDNPHQWTIVMHHHPLYSVSVNSDNNAHLRKAWQPLYDKYGVDLVLQGHDHCYGRTNLRGYQDKSSGGGTVVSAGTVYVVSVSGPKMRRVGKLGFSSSAEGIQLFQLITVDHDYLKYESRTAVGRLHDAFTLRKREGQTNELIEEFAPGERTAAEPATFE